MSEVEILTIAKWVVGGVLFIMFIMIFNKMVNYYQSIKSSKSSIQVELKNRLSLIKQVIDVAKQFIAHEKEIMTKLTNIRQSLNALDKNDINEMIKKEKSSVNTLFAVAEAYPQLRSSDAFLKLQDVIQDTEENIAASRHIYNSNVDIYNSYIKSFPALIIAGIFRYKEEKYLSFDEEGIENSPDIKSLFNN